MSLLSKLFGKGDGSAKGTQPDPEVRKIFEKIEHLLQDEAAQLELVDPKLREDLTRAPYYDKSPNGSGPFGLCKTNPIPTNGPIGELAYLSKLVTNGGERLLFHRLGAVDNIDIFEAVTFSGGQWFIFFLDMYHPKKSRIAPDGFRLSQKACQFSGFHHLCADFPYDFIEMKRREGLGPAYMPTGDILHGIKSRAYERPANHIARLEHLGAGTNRSTPVEDATTPPAPRDYQSLIERAVSNLANNTSESREALYCKARTALSSQLLGRTPLPSDSEIQREQRALEATIHRVEDTFSGEATRASKGGMRAIARDEEAKPVIELIEQLLSLQLVCEHKRAHDAFPTLMTNRLAAGYVFGFHDACFQIYGFINPNDRAAGLGLLEASYKYIFGDQAGFVLLDSSLRWQTDREFQIGRQSCFEDFTEFKSKGTPPLGLQRIIGLGLNAAVVERSLDNPA
jgi:hypothetical protein